MTNDVVHDVVGSQIAMDASFDAGDDADDVSETRPPLKDDESVEVPAGGWPWQLDYTTDIVVRTRATSGKMYQGKCTICGYTSGFTTPVRWAYHFGSLQPSCVHSVEPCTHVAHGLTVFIVGIVGHPWNKREMNMESPGIDACGVTSTKLEEEKPEHFAKCVEIVKKKKERNRINFPSGSKPPVPSQSRGRSPSPARSEMDNASAGSGMQTSFTFASLPKDKKTELLEDAHAKMALFFFKFNIPFHAIGSDELKEAVVAIKKAENYKPHSRNTLAITDLNKASALADAWKEQELRANEQYGFLLTGDGFKSKSKRQYHNYILTAPSGPVYLGLSNVTGLGGSATEVANEFQEVMDTLPSMVKDNIILGVLDTPSVNRKVGGLIKIKRMTNHRFRGLSRGRW